MYSIIKPTDKQIQRFIAIQRRRSFSYAEVGMTNNSALPTDYTVDHNRIQLGVGTETFARAKTAIKHWKMFDFDWVKLCWPEASVEVGSTVAIMTRALGIWSVNACRIAYLIEEKGAIKKFGFAYGTLPDHVGRGEERFSVEWNREDGTVWYDLLAFSKPNQLPSKMAYGFMRTQQKRFAAASMQAMVKAVNHQ